MGDVRIDSINIQEIPVDQLKFDRLNPRLPSRLINEMDESAVLEWMLEDATILELMGSIGEQGYFNGEPLLVIPAEDEAFEVVEGNRRLAAVKLLRYPESAPVRKKAVRAISDSTHIKPVTLPAIIYPKRENFLDYLGYRHVTGIKPWNPLAKARYLAHLLPTMPGDTAREQYKAAARVIGSRADYAQRLLTALAVYDEIAVENNFFRIRQLDEESLNFSLITTALSYSAITDFLGLHDDTGPELEGLDPARLQELTTWMFEKNDQGQTRLGESRNLRQLNVVVGNERALAAFRNHRPLEAAYTLTAGPASAFTTALVSARASLQTARDGVYLVDLPSNGDSDDLMCNSFS